MSDFKLKFIQRVKKRKKNLENVRFGLNIFTTRQVSKWKFYIAIHFGLNVLQRVTFELKFFPTCQNIKWKIYNTLDLDTKFLERVRFWKKIVSKGQVREKNAFKISCFGSSYSVKLTYFAFFFLFWKAWF